VGLDPEAVELQVDLDALAVALQVGEQLVVLGDLDAVGIEQDAADLPLQHGVEQRPELRVDGRLAARQHQHVQAPVLTRQPRVEARQHLAHRHRGAQLR
jgi:hypothetical protein